MPHLKAVPTVSDLQRYVGELERERGGADKSALEQCFLLGEALGGLFRAVREHGLSMDQRPKPGAVDEELAELFVRLCSLANRYGVDLELAVRRSQENKGGGWR